MSRAMATDTASTPQSWPSCSRLGTPMALSQPSVVPSTGTTPPLNRSLLRGKFSGSADSTASDAGMVAAGCPSPQLLHVANF